MKKGVAILFLVLILVRGIAFSSDEYTEEEKEWLDEHRGQQFTLGLDPYAGMEYFELYGEQKGYLPDVIARIEDALDIQIHIVADKPWGEVYQELANGQIDILFGANATEERLKVMDFTTPLNKNPYIVLTKKNPYVQTIGDLDNKTIGFIENDIILEIFPIKYFNINYQAVTVKDQREGIRALESGEIDGFITSGGGVEYEFLYQNQDLQLIAVINSVTSDMTLSCLKENHMLVSLMDKVIKTQLEGEIKADIKRARQNYNRKVLRLTEAEIKTLDEGPPVIIGVPNDYLPFEYAKDGLYLGISGALINEIDDMIGLHYIVEEGDFSTLYEKALLGDIDMLSMARTEDRVQLFDFTEPYCEERDIIVGRREADSIEDVYDLEGMTVGVIDGFWHEEYLRKNLYHINIVKTDSLETSLAYLEAGKVDYIIENPTVVMYYIDGLGYRDLFKKGTTSKDSFFYFGINKACPEVTAVINKAMPFTDIVKVKENGLRTAPALVSKRMKHLVVVVGVMTFIILIGAMGIFRLITVLSFQKAQTELLKEREKLLYTDALSETYNRQYFIHKEEQLASGILPQLIMVSDLDNLKCTNDHYGHHMGDKLIKAYGNVLMDKAKGGTVIRMGGDEFLFILENAEAREGEKLIEEIKKAMKNAHLPKEFKGKIEASFGCYLRKNNEETLEEAIKKADLLMYEDKKINKRGEHG